MVQSRLPPDPKPPIVPSRFDNLDEVQQTLDDFAVWLARSFRDVNNQLNGVSEGRIVASYNAQTATPSQTVTRYAQGDFVKHRFPTEQGTAGAKYVVIGWSCISAGSPGDWKEARVLTGE